MRSLLYSLARLLGDINAVKRGPRAMGKRVVRKTVYKAVFKSINRLLK
jgi:hypothetical protein